MVKVLFVCMGNICRSPMAENIFRHMVKEAGLSDHIEVDSAGTGGWHEGEEPDVRTLAVANRYNIPVTGRARQIRPRDLRESNYIFVMDRVNYAAVNKLRQGKESAAQLQLIRDYDPTPDNGEVPDPYSDREDAFEQVYQMLDRSCAALLAHIREKHGL